VALFGDDEVTRVDRPKDADIVRLRFDAVSWRGAVFTAQKIEADPS
jgi:hypothetical protein